MYIQTATPLGPQRPVAVIHQYPTAILRYQSDTTAVGMPEGLFPPAGVIDYKIAIREEIMSTAVPISIIM